MMLTAALMGAVALGSLTAAHATNWQIIGGPAPAYNSPDSADYWSATLTVDEPLMSCPTYDDAKQVDGKDADWLKAHGCAPLNPNVKRWYTGSASGSIRRKSDGKLLEVEACVVPQSWYDQVMAKAKADAAASHNLLIDSYSITETVRQQCRYVVHHME
jgi:hypothetical protein